MTTMGEGLSRPRQCADVITRGVSERVPVRERVGHERGHAQNVQECYALCVQICTKIRKCAGDTLRDRHRFCRIRTRSPPDPTNSGLHGGAAGSARPHRRGDQPPTLSPAGGGEQSSEEKKRCSQVVARGCEAHRVRPQVGKGGARCDRAEAGMREARAGAAERGAHVDACELKVAEDAERGGRGEAALGQVQRSLPEQRRWWEHVRHSETRPSSKWRGRGRRVRPARRAARWCLGGKSKGVPGRWGEWAMQRWVVVSLHAATWHSGGHRCG